MPVAARFEAFVAPARARPALWRLVLGAALAALCWLGALVLLLGLAPAPGPPALLLYLLSFAGLLAGTLLAARLLHGRGPRTLLGPGGFRPAAFAVGVAVLAGLAAVSGLVLLPLVPAERNMPVAAWVALLPLALPALLLQCAAEEIAFRGYLTQALAARFRSPLAWWLLPAALFGVLHWDPAAYGADAPVVVLSATVTGLVLADVTVRTGNLSAAIGLHFANNVVALLLVAAPGPTGALGLFVAPVPGAGLILGDLALTMAAWLGWRRLHSRDPGSI